MAHDTHYSARRPRETLGSISNNVSSIPMPPSAMKRTSSFGVLPQAPNTVQQPKRSTSAGRMSLAPGRPNQPVFARSSSGKDLLEMGGSTVQRPSAAGRKSLMPGAISMATTTPAAQDSQRRSSVYNSRMSMGMGPAAQQSFFATAPPALERPVDPRRLKDPRVKEQMGKELLDFFGERGFEREMNHAVTAKMMSSPTQKDFNVSFQFLYRCIDPSFRFQKGMEAEIPPLLKQMRYPFEKNITKFQLGAVGGNNWHTFLGLLHWMMQLVKMMEAYAAGVYDEACAAAGFDTAADRIAFNFLCDTYRTWLSGDDDDDTPEDQQETFKPHLEVMTAAFDRLNAQNMEQLRALEDEDRALQDQIDELNKDAPRLEMLNKQIEVAEHDKGECENWQAKMDDKLEKHANRAKLLEDEIERVKAELAEAEEERRQLQLAVDAQGMTVDDIDRMTNERKRLQAGVATAAQRLEECKELVKAQEAAAAAKLETLEAAVRRYNSLGYGVGIIPSDAPNAHGEDYELHLRLSSGNQGETDRLLADPATGYAPQHILSLDLRGAVKHRLTSLRKAIHERVEAAKEQDFGNEELLSKIGEAMEEKRAEVETLEHRVRLAEQEFEETRENTAAQKMKSDAQIEKMEKELQRMRAGLTESVQLMEQREMNVNIEYEQLTLQSAALREELHTELEKILNDVIKFKVHIQQNLEAYEEFVAQEVEAECEEQEAAEREEEDETEE